MRHVSIKQGVPAPAASMERDIRVEAGAFYEWWVGQCSERGLPRPERGARSSIVIGRMLNRHSLEEMKKLGVLMFLDHGDELRGYSQHFILMSSKLDQLKEEKE